MVLPIAEPVK